MVAHITRFFLRVVRACMPPLSGGKIAKLSLKREKVCHLLCHYWRSDVAYHLALVCGRDMRSATNPSRFPSGCCCRPCGGNESRRGTCLFLHARKN